MKLAELGPRWVGHGGEGVRKKGPDGTLVSVPRRERIGVAFDCPCGCGDRCLIPFENPEDGLGAVEPDKPAWHREGTSLDALTVRPSIQRLGGCAWHGFITDGEVSEAS